MSKRATLGVVVLGSVFLSTIGIYAADTLRGVEGNMLGLVGGGGGGCGEGEVLLSLKGRSLCVDVYEASPGPECPFSEVNNLADTRRNLAADSCTPSTEKDSMPWRYISRTESEQLCARVGKRLPDNEEWYRIASGITNIDACAINVQPAQPVPAGSFDCVSPLGVHDVIGNVWEWVEGDVIDGSYGGRTLPQEGYVALVDKDGVAVETDSKAHPDFGDDYYWVEHEGLAGMVRGGFFGSRADAGVFALNASLRTDYRGAGIGFRCVSDI